MHTSTLAHQAATLDRATNRGEHWTQADLDLVAAFDGEVSDAEIAAALGRTLYAVWAIKQVADERRARMTGTTTRARGAFDRGFVDVEALFA